MTEISADIRKKATITFFVIAAITAIGLGLSDAVFSNYFKEVYDVSAFQRGLIEFPRELPGVLCILVVSIFSFLGDVRLAMVSQVLSIAGLLVLGLSTPTFTVMLVFLFINSLGMHIFVPLQDSIAMRLFSAETMGRDLGRFKSVTAAFTMLAAVLVFFGFRTGFFDFAGVVKPIFLYSAAAFVIALLLFFAFQRMIGSRSVPQPQKLRLIFKKKYRYYYALTVANGCQKQIRVVYGPWILIELLGKRADTLALMAIVGAFCGMLFIHAVGRWLDRYGVRRSVFIQAVWFIAVYLAYAGISYGFDSGLLAKTGLPVLMAYVVFIFDRMTQQLVMINTVYMRSIAEVPEDITPALSMGLSLDHVVSIACAFLGGMVWSTFGPQYVFLFTAVLSLVNLFISFKIEPQPSAAKS